MSALWTTPGAAEVRGKTRTAPRVTGPLMQKARALFPVKTAQHLSEITGYSLRACEAWLGDEAKIPVDAYAALIRSQWGLEFIIVGMGPARPAWWAWLLRAGAVASAMRRRAADRRLIEQALDAERDLSAAIARASAFSDEDFHRPYVDAFSSMAGAPDRPLATSPVSKKGRQ